MATQLTEQELHNLAMNIVGEDLEKNGFEFLGVNSKLKKDPQFVALKNKQLHFVVVRAIAFPQDTRAFDVDLLSVIKEHADKFRARTFYAGVGLGHGDDYKSPPVKGEPYSLIYDGLQKI